MVEKIIMWAEIARNTSFVLHMTKIIFFFILLINYHQKY